MKNKFLFVVPPFDAFASGGNVFNERLTHSLRQQGVDLEVVRLEDFSKQGGEIFLFDSLYLNDLALRPEIFGQPGKIYFLIHFLPSMWPPDERRFFEKEKPLLERTDGLIVTSPFSEKYLRERGLNNLPVAVIPPACPFAGTVVRRPSFEGKIRCIIAANLIPTKGVLEFLTCLAKAIYRGKAPLKITLAGSENLDLEYAALCKKLIAQDGYLSETVSYAGAFSRDEMKMLYETSDLLISPSFFETFGMVLQEARFFGVPILALKGGNTAFHVVNGVNGRLFSQMNEMVDFLGELAQNEALFKKFQEGAERMRPSSCYSWRDAAGLFKGFFEKATLSTVNNCSASKG